MPYIYFCGDSTTAAVEECSQRFPEQRIPDHRVFSEVCNVCEHGTRPSAHVSSEGARQHVKERETSLEMYKMGPKLSLHAA
jgi:hypothetical protein